MKKCKESGYYLLEKIDKIKSEAPCQPGENYACFFERWYNKEEEPEDDSKVIQVHKRVYIKVYGRELLPNLINSYLFYDILSTIEITATTVFSTQETSINVSNVNIKSPIPVSDQPPLTNFIFIMSNVNKITKEEYIMALEKTLSYLRPEEDNYITISLLLEDEKM